MTVTTLTSIVVGPTTYNLVDNDSAKDYAQTVNPVRYTVTKNGTTISKKFPSLKLAMRHYAGIVMNASLTQSIANQPTHPVSGTNTA